MKLTSDNINVGDPMPVYTSAPITRSHLVRYAGASGDFNPLHHDETFARMIGMQQRHRARHADYGYREAKLLFHGLITNI